MMPIRESVNTGTVEWSGENPGIYLKHGPEDTDYAVLALFFRVVLSPHGRGHAAIVLGAPDENRGWPDLPNFIMTDNRDMMKWIVDGWVSKMPTFRGRAGLDGMSWLGLDSVRKIPGDLKTSYSEVLCGPDIELTMVWEGLGSPIPVEVNAENSATGEHEMYSVFLEADAASIAIDGSRLPGSVQSREFFGRTMSTAFLAFSETWVTPRDKS